jgi:hypothetical protein
MIKLYGRLVWLLYCMQCGSFLWSFQYFVFLSSHNGLLFNFSIVVSTLGSYECPHLFLLILQYFLSQTNYNIDT